MLACIDLVEMLKADLSSFTFHFSPLTRSTRLTLAQGGSLTNKSRVPLVIDRDRDDAANLRFKLPVPDDPFFGGIRQHWRSR